MEIQEIYANGDYHSVLNIIQKSEERSLNLEMLYQMALIKGNYTADAVIHRANMLSSAILSDDSSFLKFAKDNLYSQMMLNIAFDILSAQIVLARDFDIKVEDIREYDNKDTWIIPITWPIAYGDMIVIHQFIKDMKSKCKKIILIMPLNRPELKQLVDLNYGVVDKVIDITQMDEEDNRHKTLGLVNDKYGCLNLAVQEHIICKYLAQVPNAIVHKMRYFPILFGQKYFAGWRIWESRADMFINEGLELPKLTSFNEERKKNQIIIHFRSGGYNNQEARDVKKNYAQKIIDNIKKQYPDYKIIRFCDKGMYELYDCENIYIEDVSLMEQAKYIAESKLFLGSHSAPQHLAVACSNTPIICINYLAQETVSEIGVNIPTLSYEPVGKQVKKIFYVKAFDKDNNELLPIHNDARAVRYENTDIHKIMEAIKEIL